MLSFIKNYLDGLRKSDESTKHRSALSIAIILSIIILSITFVILKSNFLQMVYPDNNKNTLSDNEINGVESPFSSFMNFFKDSGKQFSGFKVNVSSSFKNIKSGKDILSGSVSTTTK